MALRDIYHTGSIIKSLLLLKRPFMAKKSYYDIVNNEKPTLVDFYATWCGPCKMMTPVLKDLSKAVKGKAKILKIDIDKNQRLAKKLDVKSVPTLMIYQKGKVVWRRSGAMTKAQLNKQLQKYIIKEA